MHPIKRVQRAPVAQLDRALACGAKGHRFKSCRVYHVRDAAEQAVFFFLYGEVQEWLNWLVSKTSVPHGTRGSNPRLSAR